MRKGEGKTLTEAQVIEWFIQLALGMKYIHEKKIVHRDLKADNIFITNANEMKIGDFGISKLMT
jgi:serine/threonine protein kinase